MCANQILLVTSIPNVLYCQCQCPILPLNQVFPVSYSLTHRYGPIPLHLLMRKPHRNLHSTVSLIEYLLLLKPTVKLQLTMWGAPGFIQSRLDGINTVYQCTAACTRGLKPTYPKKFKILQFLWLEYL
uniref:Uncharacterized protein n=1 Tax=Cacopsylla melanoneura TaxID=428564 RepID=A0A8D9BYI7_9HEMI